MYDESSLITECEQNKSISIPIKKKATFTKRNFENIVCPFGVEQLIDVLYYRLFETTPKYSAVQCDIIDSIVSTDNKKTVLVVDDNSTNRKIMQRMVNMLGFNVETAVDGLEALEAFKKRGDKIDIILMDLIMPVMNGKDSCRVMRAHAAQFNKELPIIAVTANIWESKEDLIQKFGFSNVLYKPVLLQSLREELSKCRLA